MCAFQFDDNQEHDIFRIHNLAKFCESIIQFNHYISVKASGLHYVLIIVGRMSTQTQELQSLMKQLQDRIYQFFIQQYLLVLVTYTQIMRHCILHIPKVYVLSENNSSQGINVSIFSRSK